jgi:transcriptional regulator with XRE-family HTH domain
MGPASNQAQPAFGKAVRQLREKRGITQEIAAEKADLSLHTWGVIERGEGNPAYETAKRIAAALGVTLAELVKVAEKLEG